LPWIALAVALVAVAAVRVRLLGVPLERDEGEYAYLGSLILQGVPPYAEAWNMKWPGIYALYALLIGVGGPTVVAIHAGLLLANVWNALAVALLGRRLLGDAAGAVAGAAYAALSLSTAVLGLWAHAEPFALSLALAGLMFTLDAQRLERLVAAGLLLGAAVVVKQNAAPLALFGVAVVAAGPPPRAGRLTAFALAGLVPLAVTMAVLALCGVFPRFWQWTFVYVRSYGSQVGIVDGLDNLALALAQILPTQAVWWLAAAVGAAAPLWSREVRAHAPFLFGFLAAGALAASFGLFYRSQYFVLLLPALALLAGAAVHAAPAGGPRNLVAAGLALAGLATPIGVERDLLLRRTPDEVARAVYGPNPFVEAPELARLIASLTPTDARIAVIGSEPEIYFYAGRRAATGYIYMYPLMEPQPLALAMQEELIAQVEASRPEYVVFVSVDVSWLVEPGSPRRIFEWFEGYAARHYTAIARAEIARDGTRWSYEADARQPTGARYWVTLLRRNSA